MRAGGKWRSGGEAIGGVSATPATVVAMSTLRSAPVFGTIDGRTVEDASSMRTEHSVSHAATSADTTDAALRLWSQQGIVQIASAAHRGSTKNALTNRSNPAAPRKRQAPVEMLRWSKERMFVTLRDKLRAPRIPLGAVSHAMA